MDRNIYIAIMGAAKLNKGIHLNAAETHELSMDSAIAVRAAWVQARDAGDYDGYPLFLELDRTNKPTGNFSSNKLEKE